MKTQTPDNISLSDSETDAAFTLSSARMQSRATITQDDAEELCETIDYSLAIDAFYNT
jgi:hypothetical protein